jgi:hypothetical protein
MKVQMKLPVMDEVANVFNPTITSKPSLSEEGFIDTITHYHS